MPTFSAYDGTRLAYHVAGNGPPVVCLPGGPTDSAYLADLGGLSTHRQVVRLDLRGIGRSVTPRGTASCPCDRLVDDVQALRAHLGPDRADLLAHCAGANPAVPRIRPCSVRAATRTASAGSRRSRRASGPSASRSPVTSGSGPRGCAGRSRGSRRRSRPWRRSWRGGHHRPPAGRRTVLPRPLGRGGQGLPGDPGRADGPGDRRCLRRRRSLRPGGQPRRARPVPAARRPPGRRGRPGSPSRHRGRVRGPLPGRRLVVQPVAWHYPWLDDADRFTAAVAGFLGPATAPSS